ncbi:MAG: DUF3857 domain-containing protein [Daejeonella sp.]
MKKNLLLIAILFCCLSTFAQDFPYGKPTSEEFELVKYLKDTSANAVVLREFGDAYIQESNGHLIFNYHVRIKIFNSKAFNQGDVQILLYKGSSREGEITSEIKGLTFYYDQNKNMITSELSPKQIFTETDAGKYHDLKKFAMPNVSDGCIIEYKYSIESPFIRTYRNWDFQTSIPKIYSEFRASIPAVYDYNVSLRGAHKLSKNSGELMKECYTFGNGSKADCSRLTYAMSDIPAFVEEKYMTAPSNFKSALYFNLSKYMDNMGVTHKLAMEWKDVDKDLKDEEYFGKQLKKKDFFKDKMTEVTAGKSEPVDKAKAIYSFFQSWYNWNDYYGKYSDQGIKKAFESHSGSSADINLSLIAAMNSVGLSAEPVILSTRSNGALNNLFPVLSDFDYVVCGIKINDATYLLDATDPLLPFGLLPLRCINDKGRLMSFDKPSSWLDLKASEKESNFVVFNMTMDEQGKTSGKMEIVSSGYESYNKRKSIKGFNTINEYVENLDESLAKVKILNSDISNLKELDLPLTETFNIEINSMNNDLVHINPYFMDLIKENPFKLRERTYPVDLGAGSDNRVVMELTFPDKFELVEIPKPVAISLPDNGGRLLSQATLLQNKLIVTYKMELTKAIYTSQEYQYLKEFFNKVIQTQQTDYIFRKKA